VGYPFSLSYSFDFVASIRPLSPAMTGPPVIELGPFASVPLQPNIKKGFSVPSSSQLELRPRPRGRTLSSTYPSGKSPQNPIPRGRTRSAPAAPQPPQSLRSPSPYRTRRRARSAVRTRSLSRRNSRSDSRPTTPGEVDEKRVMNL
jgi:hypothetical protein